MKTTISIAHLATGDLPVHIRAMDSAKVSPGPYAVSGTSPRDHTKWDFGIHLDVTGTVEYDGRCWMPLAKEEVAGRYSSRSGIEGVLNSFVTDQFDVSERWGGKKDVMARVREIISTLLMHDGRIYVPDVVPVYSVVRRGRGDNPEFDVVPSRWVNPGLGCKRPRERLFSADESAEAVACYREAGGRRRPASIEKRTSTSFEVDIQARALKSMGSVLLDEVGFARENYLDPGFASEAWMRRLVGPNGLAAASAILAAVNSWSAGSEEILAAMDGFADRLLHKIEPDPEDALWCALDDIADAARRHRRDLPTEAPRP